MHRTAIDQFSFVDMKKVYNQRYFVKATHIFFYFPKFYFLSRKKIQFFQRKFESKIRKSVYIFLKHFDEIIERLNN